MGVRFSKSIKLGDLVKINISKSGISATIGKKGASINVGGKGTYLNLSPSIAGIKGTGVSYRKKLTGGYSSLLSSLGNKVTKQEGKEPETSNNADLSIIDNYNEELEANTNIYKYTDNVLNRDEIMVKIDEFDSESSKEIYKMAQDGDEETVESLIGAFLNNLELSYEVKVNYELEDTILYVDLDLPEIEDLSDKYPVLVKDEITYKNKPSTLLKEEYGKTVLGLGIYLAANFFNISAYIDQIVLSAFTSRRDNNGDLKDEYLYSVKYLRKIFEETDLNKLENAYDFLLKFENRINMSNTYLFKPIKPYEMASKEKETSLIDDAVAGLKELGYKVSDINEILPELRKMELNTSGEYLKEGLKLLKK